MPSHFFKKTIFFLNNLPQRVPTDDNQALVEFTNVGRLGPELAWGGQTRSPQG